MSRDIKVLIERNAASGWEVPFDIEPRFPNAKVHSFWVGEPTRSEISRVLEIDWWPIHRAVTELFFGPLAPFDMHSGIPADATFENARYLLQNLTSDDPYLGWILCDDLMIEEIGATRT